MNTQDGSKGSKEQEYLSKKVLVNGQFVTLYSINGQTWLSSPEEIPELMARLENARIMLNNPEKAEAEAQPSKPQPAEAQAPKVIQNKYRMKGPKPRPILKQGGVVIKGTPIEPISASNTVVSFSHDQQMAEEGASGSSRARVETGKSKGAAKTKAPKHIAPVLAVVGKSKKQVVAKPEAPKTPTTKSGPLKLRAAKRTNEAPPTSKKSGVQKTLNARPVVGKKPVTPKKDPKSAPMKKVAKAASKSASKPKNQKAKPTSKKKKSSR